MISSDQISSLLQNLNEKVIQCKLCPRLINYARYTAHNKIKKFSKDEYWAKPIPSFGDVKAKLLIIGPAPAAHGGNRTGRIFTGDSSGDWLAKALFETGFANKPTSTSKDDGLALKDVYITDIVRCAPPKNKPDLAEIINCSQYFMSEIKILEQSLKVILTLGFLSFNTFCKVYGIKRLERGVIFRHGARYILDDGKILITSYHPSRRNTNTGRLTWQMWIKIFKDIKSII
jgi:uracil-DNA glycosylase